MPTLDQWDDALCDWFFRPDLAGQPVLLCCDPSVPAAVAEAHGWALSDPLEDLLAAVRAAAGRPEPLNPWVRRAVRWRRAGCEGNPPWVAVLAVTVLAATGGARAETSPLVSERAYYAPLRGLLGLGPGAQPPGFDNDVRMLWTFLREWLDRHLGGARGTCTATALPHLPNVGWALSQAVLSAPERASLPRFFRSVGAAPGEDVAGHVLLAAYRHWAASGSRHSARMSRLEPGSPAAGLLAGLLRQSLLSWDGGTRDEQGRAALPLLLAYSSSRGVLRLAARVPAGLEDATVLVGDERVALPARDDLVLLPGDPAAALAGLPLPARVLPAGGAEAARLGLPLTARLTSADVHVLAADPQLGMWVEVGAASFGREHVVLVRDDAAVAAEKSMSDLAGQATPLTRVRLPAGWCAYQRFEPGRASLVPANLAPLLPAANQLAHFTGGLPLDLRARVWLADAPPDVVLPDRSDQQDGVLRLDGGILPWPTGGRLVLRGRGLGEGRHEIDVAGRVLRFSLADGGVDEDGRGDRRLTTDRRPLRHQLTVALSVQDGSSAPRDDPAPAARVEVAVCGASRVVLGWAKPFGHLGRGEGGEHVIARQVVKRLRAGRHAPAGLPARDVRAHVARNAPLGTAHHAVPAVAAAEQTGEQVGAPRRHLPHGAAQQSANAVRVDRGDDGRPDGHLSGDLPQQGAGAVVEGAARRVLTAAGDAGAGEEAPQRPRLPVVAVRGADVAGGEVAADARQRLPGEEATGGLADDLGLCGHDRHPVVSVSVRAHPASGDFAALGRLPALSALALGLVLAFVPGCGAEHAGDHPASRGGEVDLTGDRRQLQPVPVGQVDHVLEFAWGTGEAINVPADDPVDGAGLGVAQQTVPCRAGPPAERRRVVVNEHLGDAPAATLSQRPAVGLLSGHAEPCALPVLADPHVDCCPARHGVHTVALVGTGVSCPVGVARADG